MSASATRFEFQNLLGPKASNIVAQLDLASCRVLSALLSRALKLDVCTGGASQLCIPTSVTRARD